MVKKTSHAQTINGILALKKRSLPTVLDNTMYCLHGVFNLFRVTFDLVGSVDPMKDLPGTNHTNIMC
jgi:hypothetical protein